VYLNIKREGFCKSLPFPTHVLTENKLKKQTTAKNGLNYSKLELPFSLTTNNSIVLPWAFLKINYSKIIAH
jgi:hypothetical protein